MFKSCIFIMIFPDLFKIKSFIETYFDTYDSKIDLLGNVKKKSYRRSNLSHSYNKCIVTTFSGLLLIKLNDILIFLEASVRTRRVFHRFSLD